MNRPAPCSMKISVEGGELHVVRRGAGPPLLMLHGWALDHRMFRPQWRALERDFDLILPDRRGFGRSTAPPDLRREADDVITILDTLGIDQVHLLGMSQGGRIALRCAAEQPERFRSLLLQGPGVDGIDVNEPEAERIPIGEFVALARDGQLDELRRRWRGHPMMSEESMPDDALTLVDDMLASWDARDLVAHDAANYAYPSGIETALRTFRRPVLFLTGERETAARKAITSRLLGLFPDARETILADCGHLSNLAAPKAYNAAVRRFCSGIDQPRGRRLGCRPN